MACYNPGTETQFTIDASPDGLGAILSQQQDDGSFKAIAYGSHTLTDIARNPDYLFLSLLTSQG